MNNAEKAENYKIVKIVIEDIILKGKKVGERELYYNENETLIRSMDYKDMNANRKYDILECIVDYKKGKIYRQTFYKRVQNLRYNPDGSIRNISKFSD